MDSRTQASRTIDTATAAANFAAMLAAVALDPKAVSSAVSAMERRGNARIRSGQSRADRNTSREAASRTEIESANASHSPKTAQSAKAMQLAVAGTAKKPPRALRLREEPAVTSAPIPAPRVPGPTATKPRSTTASARPVRAASSGKQRTTATQLRNQRVLKDELQPAALNEELLASDTVAIRSTAASGMAAASVDLSASFATPVGWREERETRPEEPLRGWPGPKRKCVTISVRLSPADAKLLRRRANESELSVSDYLRSCVLEADQLRAQVKQVLAEMKTRTPETSPLMSVQPLHHAAQDRQAIQTPVETPRRESRLRSWLSALRGPLVSA